MKLVKITKLRPNAEKRRYDDACAATHGMDIIGERWALPVMRELMLGPRRFGDLRKSLPAISANVLTQRLTGLEEAGIVVRRKLPPPVSAQVYALTPWGAEAGPVFQALGRWAVKSPRHDPTRPFSAVSLLLSMRSMADPARLAEFAGRISIHIADEDYFFLADHGEPGIGRGEIPDVNLSIVGASAAIAACLYAGAPLDTLAITGDRALAERFVALFLLPPKAA